MCRSWIRDSGRDIFILRNFHVIKKPLHYCQPIEKPLNLKLAIKTGLIHFHTESLRFSLSHITLPLMIVPKHVFNIFLIITQFFLVGQLPTRNWMTFTSRINSFSVILANHLTFMSLVISCRQPSKSRLTCLQRLLGLSLENSEFSLCNHAFFMIFAIKGFVFISCVRHLNKLIML